MAKSKRDLQDEQRRRWEDTCAGWMKCREELPPAVMDMLRQFDHDYFAQMEANNLSPAIALVGLSHLVSRIVDAHMACPPPENYSEQDWIDAIYQAISDCVCVAHSLRTGLATGVIQTAPRRPATYH